MPPLYLIQRPPSMLPTVELTGYGLGLNVRRLQGALSNTLRIGFRFTPPHS
jgi:hypothetical protein